MHTNRAKKIFFVPGDLALHHTHKPPWKNETPAIERKELKESHHSSQNLRFCGLCVLSRPNEGGSGREGAPAKHAKDAKKAFLSRFSRISWANLPRRRRKRGMAPGQTPISTLRSLRSFAAQNTVAFWGVIGTLLSFRSEFARSDGKSFVQEYLCVTFFEQSHFLI